MTQAAKKLDIAMKHLEKVQSAWQEPDWSDLAIYGLLSLENAVVAAAEYLNIEWKPTHPSQVKIAQTLKADHNLPDVVDLLRDLFRMRQYESYGDIQPSGDYSPEDVADLVEEFVTAVDGFIGE